jgi:hypothetical protein
MPYDSPTRDVSPVECYSFDGGTNPQRTTRQPDARDENVA